VTWNGGGADNNVSTGANWSGGGAPNAGSDVVINTTGRAIVWDSSAPTLVNSILIDTGFTGTVTLTGALATTGSLTINAATLKTAFGGVGALSVGTNLVIGSAGNVTVQPPGQAVNVVGSVSIASGGVLQAQSNAFLASGFETPDEGSGNFGSFQYGPIAGSPWNFDTSTGISGNGSGFSSGNPNAPEGGQVGLIQMTGTFSQTVNLSAGTYHISLQSAQRSNYQASFQVFDIRVDGTSVGTFQPVGINYETDVTSKFTVTAGSHTVSFVGLNPNTGDNTVFVDDVKFYGSSGYGSIQLTAGGSVTVDGTISANGVAGIVGGGGAAGSITIIAPAVTGSGAINANGGDGDAVEGGGAGGQIAIHPPAAVSPNPLTFNYAFGGKLGVAPGANGTQTGSIYIPPTISSAVNQSFKYADPTTPGALITITNRSVVTSGAVITAGNDIRIKIPSTFAMSWDTAVTTATLGGSAAGKVSTTVSYAGLNQTLILDVTTDFAPGDTLTVSGLSFKNFGGGSAPNPDNLELEILNNGATQAEDDKTVTIAKAILTVTANNASMVYGAALPAFSVGFSGFLNGDTASVVTGAPAFSTPATPASGVGTYPIIPALGTLSSTNYTFVFVNGTLTVTPATLVVTATSFSNPFGTAIPPLPYTFSGFHNSDTAAVVSGAPAITTTATSLSPEGPYPITVALGTLSAANYVFTFVNGTLTIVPVPPQFGAITLTPAPALVNQQVIGATSVAVPRTLGGVVWDFGDGTTASGLNVQHAWSQAGVYVVTITATGLDGATTVDHVSIFISLTAGGQSGDSSGGGIVIGSGNGAGALPPGGKSKLGKAKAKIDFGNPQRTIVSGSVGLINFPSSLKQSDLTSTAGNLTLGTGTLAQTYIFYLNASGKGSATALPKIGVSVKKKAMYFVSTDRSNLTDLLQSLGATWNIGAKSGPTLPLTIPATLQIGNKVYLAMTFRLTYRQAKNTGKADSK
jgi:hypothetical protein